MESMNTESGVDEMRSLYPGQFAGPIISLDWPGGWHGIVSRVCQQVAMAHPGVRWVQIKQKLGGLRMYYRDEPLRSDAAALNDLIRVAVQQSLKTCELCGEFGDKVMRHSIRRRITTLCPDCASAAHDSNAP